MFFKKRQPPALREIVEITLRNHPKDCVFTPNALELILKELEGVDIASDPSASINAIVTAIQRQEMYCPHEGIDKRDQFKMSFKDQNYYRRCPICKDILPGTDDGLEVYESLKGQLEAAPAQIPNCTLCGEDCESLQTAVDIVAAGEPKLKDA